MANKLPHNCNYTQPWRVCCVCACMNITHRGIAYDIHVACIILCWHIVSSAYVMYVWLICSHFSSFDVIMCVFIVNSMQWNAHSNFYTLLTDIVGIISRVWFWCQIRSNGKLTFQACSASRSHSSGWLPAPASFFSIIHNYPPHWLSTQVYYFDPMALLMLGAAGAVASTRVNAHAMICVYVA